MSGPKRADVEAQLNVARDAQRKCACLIAKAHDSVISALILDAGDAIRRVEAIESEIKQTQRGFTPDMQRVAGDSIEQVGREAKSAGLAAREAQKTLEGAKASVQQAQRDQSKADHAFAEANRAYEQAAAELRGSGNHELNVQMKLAKQARKQFDEASYVLKAAEQTRKEAERKAGDALRQARNALSSVDSVRGRLSATISEAQSRIRAEEEARQIAEEKKRRAVLALENARAAVNRINDLPHAKFAPGKLPQLSSVLADIHRQIEAGTFDQSYGNAEQLAARARQLEEEVVRALEDFEQRKNEAESSAIELSAAIGGVDQELIEQWSGKPEAFDTASNALKQIQKDIAGESFDGVRASASHARETLMEAMRLAAENKSSHEKRTVIGEAVMVVLEELGFDVSCDEGSLSEALKISAQTPEASGRGDFGIEIPLDGEVDFQVNASESDTTCVAAIEALQDRLRERGVEWNTTDWGHAEGAEITEQTKTRQREKSRIKHGMTS